MFYIYTDFHLFCFVNDLVCIFSLPLHSNLSLCTLVIVIRVSMCVYHESCNHQNFHMNYYHISGNYYWAHENCSREINGTNQTTTSANQKQKKNLK